MKKAVVTGGAGFIGSHIVENLLGKNYDVTVLDNLSTGRISNISSWVKDGSVEFVQGSITNPRDLKKAFAGANYVFHEAAIPSVPKSIKRPRPSHDANATGTLNVLIAARDAGVEKLVYASSSSAYGDTPTLPKSEDMAPNPLSPYAVSKLAAEYYCSVFTGVYGLPTASLRYFNVYGPRQDPNSPYAAVIPIFLRLLQNGQSPVIFGDGEQTRDFTFVKDVAEANVRVAESSATGIFNLGNSQRITLNELTNKIREITGHTDIKPVYQSPRPGDIKHSLADISKAKVFGYDPKYGIDEGLKETCAYFLSTEFA